MAKTKKRADGLIERCRVIDGKTRHFYGRTAKEVQAKLDAALIEASTRRDRGDPLLRGRRGVLARQGAVHQVWLPPGLPPQGGACQGLV